MAAFRLSRYCHAIFMFFLLRRVALSFRWQRPSQASLPNAVHHPNRESPWPGASGVHGFIIRQTVSKGHARGWRVFPAKACCSNTNRQDKYRYIHLFIMPVRGVSPKDFLAVKLSVAQHGCFGGVTMLFLATANGLSGWRRTHSHTALLLYTARMEKFGRVGSFRKMHSSVPMLSFHTSK